MVINASIFCLFIYFKFYLKKCFVHKNEILLSAAGEMETLAGAPRK